MGTHGADFPLVVTSTLTSERTSLLVTRLPRVFFFLQHCFHQILYCYDVDRSIYLRLVLRAPEPREKTGEEAATRWIRGELSSGAPAP